MEIPMGISQPLMRASTQDSCKLFKSCMIFLIDITTVFYCLIYWFVINTRILKTFLKVCSWT